MQLHVSCDTLVLFRKAKLGDDGVARRVRTDTEQSLPNNSICCHSKQKEQQTELSSSLHQSKHKMRIKVSSIASNMQPAQHASKNAMTMPEMAAATMM